MASSIPFKNQINMEAAPTEDNHLLRVRDGRTLERKVHDDIELRGPFAVTGTTERIASITANTWYRVKFVPDNGLQGTIDNGKFIVPKDGIYTISAYLGIFVTASFTVCNTSITKNNPAGALNSSCTISKANTATTSTTQSKVPGTETAVLFLHEGDVIELWIWVDTAQSAAMTGNSSFSIVLNAYLDEALTQGVRGQFQMTTFVANTRKRVDLIAQNGNTQDVKNGVYIVPKTGDYLISMYYGAKGTATSNSYQYISKNHPDNTTMGDIISRSFSGNSGGTDTVFTIEHLQKGDTISFWLYTDVAYATAQATNTSKFFITPLVSGEIGGGDVTTSQVLKAIEDALNAHNEDAASHPAIRQEISDVASAASAAISSATTALQNTISTAKTEAITRANEFTREVIDDFEFTGAVGVFGTLEQHTSFPANNSERVKFVPTNGLTNLVNAQGQFIVPEDGIYDISAFYGVLGTPTTDFRMFFSVNNPAGALTSQYQIAQTIQSSAVATGGTSVLSVSKFLQQGDIVECWIRVITAQTQASANDTSNFTIVKKAYLDEPITGGVRGTIQQLTSIVASSGTRVKFLPTQGNTQDIDASGAFIVPKTGIYSISAHYGVLGSTSTSAWFFCTKNNPAGNADWNKRIGSSHGDQTLPHISFTVYLQKGDKIEVWIYSTTAQNTANARNESWFNICPISGNGSGIGDVTESQVRQIAEDTTTAHNGDPLAHTVLHEELDAKDLVNRQHIDQLFHDAEYSGPLGVWGTLQQFTSLTLNVWTRVKFIPTNGFTDYINASGQFVVPKDGIYDLSAYYGTLDAATNASIFAFTKNNPAGTCNGDYFIATCTAARNNATLKHSTVLSTHVYLRAGDIIELWIYVDVAQSAKPSKDVSHFAFTLKTWLDEPMSNGISGTIEQLTSIIADTWTRAKFLPTRGKTQDIVNGVFIVPKTGDYILSACYGFINTTAVDIWVTFTINNPTNPPTKTNACTQGFFPLKCPASGNTRATPIATITKHLQKGDKVEFWIYTSSAQSAEYSSDYSHFTICPVGSGGSDGISYDDLTEELTSLASSLQGLLSAHNISKTTHSDIREDIVTAKAEANEYSEQLFGTLDCLGPFAVLGKIQQLTAITANTFTKVKFIPTQGFKNLINAQGAFVVPEDGFYDIYAYYGYIQGATSTYFNMMRLSKNNPAGQSVNTDKTLSAAISTRTDQINAFTNPITYSGYFQKDDIVELWIYCHTTQTSAHSIDVSNFSITRKAILDEPITLGVRGHIDQSIPISAGVVTRFPLIADVGNTQDIVNGVYIAPRSGNYMLSAFLERVATTPTGESYFYITKNNPAGSIQGSCVIARGSFNVIYTQTLTTVEYLQKDDKIEVWVFTNVAQTTTPSSNFSRFNFVPITGKDSKPFHVSGSMERLSSIAALIWTRVKYVPNRGDTTTIDANGRFVVPKEGVYRFSVRYGGVNNQQTYCYIALSKNVPQGQVITTQDAIARNFYMPASPTVLAPDLSYEIYLEKNDIIEFWIYCAIAQTGVDPNSVSNFCITAIYPD